MSDDPIHTFLQLIDTLETMPEDCPEIHTLPQLIDTLETTTPLEGCLERRNAARDIAEIADNCHSVTFAVFADLHTLEIIINELRQSIESDTTVRRRRETIIALTATLKHISRGVPQLLFDSLDGNAIIQTLGHLFSADISEARNDATMILRDLTRRDPLRVLDEYDELIQSLNNTLTSDSDHTKRNAAHVLGNLVEEDPARVLDEYNELIRNLDGLLTSEDNHLNGAAAGILGLLAREAPLRVLNEYDELIQHLDKPLMSSDAQVSTLAALALGDLARGDPTRVLDEYDELIHNLDEPLNSDCKETQTEAAAGVLSFLVEEVPLRMLSNYGHLIHNLEKLLKSENDQAKESAAHVLSLLVREDPVRVLNEYDDLIQHLDRPLTSDSEDTLINRFAAFVLRELAETAPDRLLSRHDDLVKQLCKCVDASSTSRHLAANVLVTVVTHGQTSPKAHALLEDITDYQDSIEYETVDSASTSTAVDFRDIIEAHDPVDSRGVLMETITRFQQGELEITPREDTQTEARTEPEAEAQPDPDDETEFEFDPDPVAPRLLAEAYQTVATTDPAVVAEHAGAIQELITLDEFPTAGHRALDALHYVGSGSTITPPPLDHHS